MWDGSCVLKFVDYHLHFVDCVGNELFEVSYSLLFLFWKEEQFKLTQIYLVVKIRNLLVYYVLLTTR